jgi:hypothetical protein
VTSRQTPHGVVLEATFTIPWRSHLRPSDIRALGFADQLVRVLFARGDVTMLDRVKDWVRSQVDRGRTFTEIAGELDAYAWQYLEGAAASSDPESWGPKEWSALAVPQILWGEGRRYGDGALWPRQFPGPVDLRVVVPASRWQDGVNHLRAGLPKHVRPRLVYREDVRDLLEARVERAR